MSTAADYLRFCRMLLNGGSLDGVRLLGRKTVQLMTMNHLPEGKDLPALSRSLFSEAIYNGVGFGLGFAVTLDPARTLIPGSAGEFSWGGMASTAFWIDPAEDLIAIFMTQLMPSTSYPVRRELRTLVYSALEDVGGTGPGGRIVRADVRKASGGSAATGTIEVALTPTEFRLLAALIRHPGQTLTPDQLLRLAWNDPLGVGPDRVKFGVMRLRRKLGQSEGTGSPIEAVRGFGYRYVTPPAGSSK